jgi:hypothetical protein
MVSSRQRRLYYGSGELLALLVLVLLSLPLMASACRGSATTAEGSEKVQIDLKLLTEKATGPATIEVTLHTPDGKPLDGAEVAGRGDMNHAGMKPVLATTRAEGAGRYVTQDFRFTMGGDWIITADVVLPGGEKVSRTVDISGVAGRQH